jgi:hypothetical protein
MAVTWAPPAAPTVAAVALSGLALSQSTSSLTLLAGKFLRVMISCGVTASNAIGAKSRSTSYGSE